KNAGGEVDLLLRDQAAHLDAGDGESGGARVFAAAEARLDLVTEDARPSGKVLDQAGDGVVRRHGVQAGDGRLHFLLVDAARVGAVGNVGLRLLEGGLESALQFRAAGFAGELQRAGCIL